MRYTFLFLILLATSGYKSEAQLKPYLLDDKKNLSQFNYDRWTTENGLPTNSLLHIYQSSDGYLWLSSYGGIIRFDGNRFTIFNKKNIPDLENNSIGRIGEDLQGNIWFTTQGNGLVSYKNGSFHSYGKEEGFLHLYRALYIDKQNTVYSASSEKGWFLFKNGQFTLIDYPSSLASIEVRSIVEGPNGEIYFGTLGEGLFKYEHGKLTHIPINNSLPIQWIYSLYFTNEKMLLIGTSEGLFQYNGESFSMLPMGTVATINVITEDINGSIWLGTNNGIVRLKNRENSNFSNEVSICLPNSFINDLIFDLEGNLWLTNYKDGLTRVKDGKFTNYNLETGLLGKAVNSICEIGPQKFLLAFDNGQLNCINNGEVFPYKTKTSLSGKRVRHIYKDSKSNIWFSTYDGLLKRTPQGKEFFYHPNNGFPASKIRITYEDSKGNIWVGTRNNGLIKIKPDGTVQVIDVSSGLSSMLIMSIDEDFEGRLLVGTNDGGLNIIINDKVVDVWNKKRGLPSDIVFNVHQSKDSSIWIAMNGGLACIRHQKVYTLSTANGLADDTPFDIVEDESGNFWLPCIAGIMKINSASLHQFIQGKPNSYEIYLYNRKDGMHQEECNATSQSIRASNGSLLFPTIDGITQISPAITQINTLKPNVVIETLTINNQLANLFEPILIRPGKNRLTFEFTALSLHEPQKNNFRYQLIGYEDDWTNSGNIRTVSYTNLPPGYYTFKVIASNNDGIWNDKGDMLSFRIKPLFVQTRLFYFLLLLVVFAIVYSIYIYRINQLKRQQRNLEETVKRRTIEITLKNKELQEQKYEIQSQAEKLAEQKSELEKINADKDKMFSIIAHDLRSPMGNFKSMLESLTNSPKLYDENSRRKILLALTEIAKNTFDLLENLLNWSKSKMGVMAFEPDILLITPLLQEIINLSKPLADKKNISIINTIDSNLSVYADQNMVKTIFRNLLMNAIKFTGDNGRIEIYVKSLEDFYEFYIKDNGVGMSPEVQNNLFSSQNMHSSSGTHHEKGSGLGLILCKEFVEQNGGSIRVESILNNGSVFVFTLKANPA